jgi:hypothetical protein
VSPISLIFLSHDLVVSARLKEGHSKKEIYEELSGQVKFRMDLLRLLAMVPDYEDRIKYKKINLILFCLIVFVAVTKVIISPHFFLNTPFYMLPLAAFAAFMWVFFVISVWNFRGLVYRFIGLFGSIALISSILKFKDWSSYDATACLLKLSLGWIPGILIIVLSYYIGFKVFPYYSFWGRLQERKLGL